MDRHPPVDEKAKYRLIVALGMALVTANVVGATAGFNQIASLFVAVLSGAYGFFLCARATFRSKNRFASTALIFAMASLSSIPAAVAVAVRDPSTPWSAFEPANVALAVFQVLALLGCFTLVALPTVPGPRARAFLDQLIIGIVSGVVVVEVGYKHLFEITDGGLWANSMVFGWVAGDCLIVTLVISISLALRPRGRLSTPVLVPIATGLLGFVVVDLISARLSASGPYPFVLLATTTSCTAIAFGIAATWRRPFVRRSPRVTQGLAYGQLLPSIAAAAVLMLVLAEQVFASGPDKILTWLASSLVVCVLVRQVIGWLEEQRLLRLLEARVADRTEALGRRERQFRALVQQSSDVIVIVQSNGSCDYVSPSLQHVFGHSAEKMAEGNILDIVHHDDRSRVLALMAMAMKRPGESFTAEWRVMKADGTGRQVEVLVRNLLAEPAVAGLVINLRDVTERKELEDRLSYQALHDDLTGLANRSLLRLRIEQALARWLFQDEPFSLLVVDLDDFKAINDSLGHVAGDLALKMVAERIAECTRHSDTVVRLDGDEFAVLLDGVAAGDEEARLVAERIGKSVHQPMRIEGRSLALQASIGLACVTEQVSQADDIMRNADLALHSAKAAGRGGFVKFEVSMHDAALNRVEIEADLRRALERDELQLFYQPTVDIETGRLQGVEALLRWPHPDKGFIPPMEFIPVAEESGLIVPIGTWVMEQACLQMAKWQMRYPSETPLKMNVNLSGRQFDQPDIVEVVQRVIELTGIAPGSLVLEVTESVLMENRISTRTKMEQLVALGCDLAIDDFGTGYSSLSYLQQFPITVLKIDRSFINEIATEGSGEGPALVRAILDIARTLQLRTVAEGIETEDQLVELRRMGCETGQGFYLARPAPQEDVRRLIEATHAKGLPLPAAAPKIPRT